MIKTQAELNEWFEDLKDAGYPYRGGNWILLANGDIRDQWVTNDGEIDFVDSTQEELAESVFCWFHDC